MLLALVGALALQTTLSGSRSRGGAMVNLVLVAVVYVALPYGPVTGLLAGTVGGLAQDALAGGIVGVGGMAKTLVGFLVGVLARSSSSRSRCRGCVMFLSATLVHEVCSTGCTP